MGILKKLTMVKAKKSFKPSDQKLQNSFHQKKNPILNRYNLENPLRHHKRNRPDLPNSLICVRVKMLRNHQIRQLKTHTSQSILNEVCHNLKMAKIIKPFLKKESDYCKSGFPDHLDWTGLPSL